MNTSRGSVTRIIGTRIIIIARDRGVRATTLGHALIVGTGVTIFTNNRILYTTASTVTVLSRTIIGIVTVNLYVMASSYWAARINSTGIAIIAIYLNMNTCTIVEGARVYCTQVVIITINRGLSAESSGFVTRRIVAEIIRFTHNGLITTNASFATICCAKIIIIANNRLTNTRTSIHITVISCTKVIVLTNKWGILAA